MTLPLQTWYQLFLRAIRTGGHEKAVIHWVKIAHTVIFLSLLVCVIDITVACFRNRLDRRSKIALAAVTVEGAIFALNRRRCPLTLIVEDLGDEHGQVTDIFLPDVLAKNIFTISMALLASGGVAALFHCLRRPA